MPTILLVEDSPTEAYVIADILARHGYQTLTAATGEEGIDMARNHRPDLILMDVVMPGLNGFQTTRKLAKDEQTAHIPVIVVSSKDQDTDRIWAIRQGARDYIVKPVKEDLLIDRVQAHLAQI
ncbi:MAG: response regulator [Gammaproteobacteria bacterium]|nr:response regulator [Gammaproteobacteria bacterium]